MKTLLTACFMMLTATLMTVNAQSYDFRDFDGIALGISANVTVSKGDYKVEVTGPEKSLNGLEIKVKGGTLGIGTKRGVRGWSSKGIKVHVTMPNISSVSIAGSGDVDVEDEFNNMNGLEISIGGSGNVKIGGKAKNIEVSVAGSGDVDAAGVDANSAEVSIAGSGNVRVGDVKNLEVSIAGSGDVYYKGNPSVEKSVAGSGNIRRL